MIIYKSQRLTEQDNVQPDPNRVQATTQTFQMQPGKRYVCIDEFGNQCAVMVTKSGKNKGRLYYRNTNGRYFWPYVDEIKEAEPLPQNVSLANEIQDNSAKVAITNQATPVQNITLNNGQLMIESISQSTHKILESLSIECPSYLYTLDEAVIPYSGTSLNSLFNKDIQDVLTASNAEVSLIAYDQQKNDFILKTTDGRPFFLNQLKQQAEHGNQQQPQEEEQSQEEQAQGDSVATKMSKQDINIIANTVANALNKKVNKYGGYTIKWDVVSNGFDASTLREGVVGAIKKAVANKTKNGMNNKSLPTTFKVKMSLYDDKGKEVKIDDSLNDAIQDIAFEAGKILNNVLKFDTTDTNGNPYKATATFQLSSEPVKDGVITYTAQTNSLLNTADTSTTQQHQDHPQQQNGKNNKPFWWDQASKRQQKRYIKNVTSGNTSSKKGSGLFNSKPRSYNPSSF